MEEEAPSSLFVNDGSFMERFKQLQQEKAKDTSAPSGDPKQSSVVSRSSNPSAAKTPLDGKANNSGKSSQPLSGGKLAFSLKQKSKLVAPPVKLAADEDEDDADARSHLGDTSVKRQKLSKQDAYGESSGHDDVAPPSPRDPTVKKVADKLASFVAKNGRHLEDMSRQKNPGDTPFKFLFDKTCADYKYYEYRLAQEEKALSLQSKEPQKSRNGRVGIPESRSNAGSQRINSQANRSNYQTPASALYEATDGSGVASDRNVESGSTASADPVAMMEFYMKKAAQEERRRQPRQSKDEMPPPPSLQGPSKKGHHMGDFIPPEELERFLVSCNDASAQRTAREAAERARIQADNVGHKLLSKMGWKEGEGLGSSRSGIADPIMAGEVKKNNLGVGAQNPGEVAPEDDIYEQYKKRMMLGYRYRPNPLNNPRKAYY
ncbi:hypothetical protein ACJRO7_004182 [Eucalyptus globulus]|uniref:SURP and G-patch domain-containing protein 1-like protein n=1 Tax=Eucalyptus globulus TaxID=34317 RepID=A0ABD3IZ81_EUCGL